MANKPTTPQLLRVLVALKVSKLGIKLGLGWPSAWLACFIIYGWREAWRRTEMAPWRR